MTERRSRRVPFDPGPVTIPTWHNRNQRGSERAVYNFSASCVEVERKESNHHATVLRGEGDVLR